MVERTKALELIDKPQEKTEDFPKEGFVFYLVTNQLSHPSSFPSILDLSSFTQTMEALHLWKQETHVMDEEERSILTSMISNGREPSVHAMGYVNQKGEAERATAIYYDPQTGEAMEESNIGSYSEVGLEGFFKLISEGKVPLITFHTHPTDTLFSSVDFKELIVRDPRDESPICKATVVICPNIQILAVATSQTRFFIDVKSAKEYLSDWENGVQTQVENDQNAQLVLADFREVRDKIISMPQQFREKISRVEERFFEEAISKERAIQLVDLTTQAYERARNVLHERAIATLCNLRQYSLFFADNTSRVELARTLGLKLYFSTDMRRFREFSA